MEPIIEQKEVEQRSDPPIGGKDSTRGGRPRRGRGNNRRQDSQARNSAKPKEASKAKFKDDRKISSTGSGSFGKALDMLISKYGNAPVISKRFDFYTLDATGYTNLLQTFWKTISDYDITVRRLYDSTLFYYAAYLSLLKRVAQIQSSVFGSSQLVKYIVDNVPDFSMPQPIQLYLEGLGVVDMQDGTQLMPDVLLAGLFDEVRGEYSELRYLSGSDRDKEIDFEKVFPLIRVQLQMRFQINPEYDPRAFPFPGRDNAGNIMVIHAFEDLNWTFPNFFVGPNIFDESNLYDPNDSNDFDHFVFVDRGLFNHIFDLLSGLAVYCPVSAPPVTVVGDISQLAISQFSDNFQTLSVEQFRPSEGFSLKAARLFNYRRRRSAAQCIVPGNNLRFGDYVKINPPSPRMTFVTYEHFREIQTYINAFLTFKM